MKNIKLLVFIIVFGSSCFAMELPKHSPMKELVLSSIGTSNEVVIAAKVVLPSDHKLNKHAPSAIDFYEKGPKGWEKLTSINLRNAFPLASTIELNERVKLKSNKSKIALDSTIYHCDHNNQYCVIESFQGIAKRTSNNLSNTLTVAIAGSRP